MSCSAQNRDYDEQTEKINSFLQNVSHKLLVMSGKGGVGKSTVAANLAVFLSERGYRTGLLDVDVHGPSIAGLLGLVGLSLNFVGDKIQPYPYSENLKVLSIQGFLQHPDDPLIWRGPIKIGIIRQFLSDVDWGPLDFLIIDSPPGTGDEPLTVAQTIPGCRAVLVTTPQAAAARVAIRVAQMSKKVGQDVLGVVENMAYFRCPTCGEETAIFGAGGGEALARELAVPLLGRLPIDAELPEGGDEGRPAVWERPEGEPSRIFREIAREIDAHRSWPRALPSPTGTL